MGQFDFEPMMSFLRARLPEHHPVYRAALQNDLAAFMAALRDVGERGLFFRSQFRLNDAEMAGQ